MRKTLITAAVGLAMTLGASQANALTIGDAFYLGQVVNGAPADPVSEATYINSLRALAPGAAAVPCSLAAGETCDRIGSTLAGAAALPAAVSAGDFREDPTDGSINVTGFQWLLAKYGGESLVWYVGGLSGIQTVPTAALSHMSLYNPGTVTVPDGGATLGLLGLGMLGLGYLRRRKQ